MITKLMMWSLVLILAIMPVFAYHSELYQWNNLNKTSPYINEFMICYLRNSTTIIWDTYNGGVAQFFTPNETLTYDIYCCDNCRIDNNISIHLSPNSLHYLVDDDVNISTDTIFEYAINDIIEEYRTIFTIASESSPSTIFDDYHYGDFFSISWIMVLIIVLTFPLGAWILTGLLNVTLLFFGIGLVIGSFLAYSLGLLTFLTFIVLEVLLIGIMWFIGKMIR